MAKDDREKVMVTEHVLEIRHQASGTFLDVRGSIADYIRSESFFKHWKIDPVVVNFRDSEDQIKAEAAFVGYKSAGFVALNPPTRNYFTDRATAFWRVLLKNKNYPIPDPVRFGNRTKFFIPSNKSFEEINKSVYEGFFTEKGRNLIGGQEKDVQFTVEFKEVGFEARIAGGPIHKKEAKKYFQFESELFEKSGIFFDLDFYKSQSFPLEAVPKLLKESMDLMWQKTERIVSGVGL